MTSIVATVFAVAGLMVVVSLLPSLAQRLRVPYSVVLALVGIAVGLGASVVNAAPGGGFFDDLFAAWGNFTSSSTVFLVVFLPVLLFEASLGIEVRALLDDLFPVLALAVVAVVLATFFVGITLAAVGPYSLLACLLLASIISTTDPAAVIAIFRDLGAPRRLTLLVEGESVFNDAAAITLFSLLSAALVEGSSISVLGGLGEFLVEFLGGFASGLAFAFGASLLLPSLKDNRLAELTLTVAGTYLVYIATNTYLHASGVVAVVIFSLGLGVLGRTRIAPENWRYLRTSWATLGFWANSLIFLLAAMLTPPTLAGMTWHDALLLVALIVAALAARLVVLFGLLPALAAVRLAARVSNAYKLVIAWGGMRGAVTLALALAATEEALPADVKRFVMLLATTYVLSTLLVNGLTLKPLIRLLGLDRMSAGDQAIRDRVLAISLAAVKRHAEDLAADHRIDPLAAQEVSNFYERRLGELASVAAFEAAGAQSAGDQGYAGLVTLGLREQAAYLRLFERRVIGRDVVAPLLAQATQLTDAAKAGGITGYVAVADRILAFSRGFRLALWLQRRLGVVWLLTGLLERRFERLLMMQATLMELQGFLGRTLEPMLGAAAAVQLTAVLDRRRAALEAALDGLKLQYPAYSHELQARYLSRAAMGRETIAYREMLDEEVIGEEIHEALQREVDERRQRIARPPRLDLGLGRDELVCRVPMFCHLSPASLAAVAALLRPHLALPGEAVVSRGEQGDEMYFISSGAVEVELDRPVRLGTGSFFGEVALLFEEPRNATVRALGFCQLLSLDRRDFARLAEADPTVHQLIMSEAATRRRPPPAP